MCLTSAAYSAGLPMRDGNGTILPSDSCTSGGMPSSIGVSMIPGAMVMQRIPLLAKFAGHRQVMATIPPFDAA
jgi:hypothetical protein